MSATRINPEPQPVTYSLANTFELAVCGKVAQLSAYFTGFAFDDTWQVVAQLPSGIVPKLQAHSYYQLMAFSNRDRAVWLYIYADGRIAVRGLASATGFMGSVTFLLA